MLEELDFVLNRLTPLHREIDMRTLAGDTSIAVAEGVDRTEQSVWRVLVRFHTTAS
ncbi:MAG: hypothetical protein ACKVHE_29050 [Planctomycetales bacterium]